ncbi:MAG: hypothetical protein ABI419_01140 [Ginsengibacter sp.]
MAFKIIVKPIVWWDLEEAITWYESERSGLGWDFFIHFEEAKERVLANPNAYQIIIPGVRRILIRKFPYKIFYTISENSIFLIGLIHAKRSNAFIRKRLKTL